MSIEKGHFNQPKTENERRYSKEKIDRGFDFARSLFEKGILSDEEINAIVSAYNSLKRGESSELENNLLAKWADKAEFAKIREQNDAKLRKHVLEKIGPDTLETIENIIHSIDSSIKIHFLNMKEKNPTDVENILNLWRDFSNNLFVRISSENLWNPKRVEAALKLANALLQAKLTQEGSDAAKEGIEVLRKLYGI
jgi:hypothetical protein